MARQGGWLKPWGLAGLAVCLPVGGGAGPRAEDPATLGQFALRVFDERDGLPQSTVEAVALDVQGYLWFGTQDGVMRYDGRHLMRLALPDPEEGAWVTSILSARDGSLWCGTHGSGLHRWKDGAWTSFKPRTGVPLVRVRGLVERSLPGGGTEILVGSHQEGLWSIREGVAKPVSIPWGRTPPWVYTLLLSRCSDGSEVLWVGTDRGLWRQDARGWNHVDASHWGGRSQAVQALAVEGDTLWVGTDEGVIRGPLDNMAAARRDPRLGDVRVYSLAVSPAPRGGSLVWAATDRGLGIREGARWRLMDASYGLPSAMVNTVRTLIQPGRPPLVFAGTFAGLVRLSPWGWRSLTTRSGLTDNLVFALQEDGEGRFFVGTGGNGLNELRGERWIPVDRAEGRPIGTVLQMAGSRQRNRVYVGTEKSGLLVGEGGRWRWWSRNAELPDQGIFALLEREGGAPVDGHPARSGPEGGRGVAARESASGLAPALRRFPG